MQKWQLVDVERFNRVLQHLNPFHQHRCQVVSMKTVYVTLFFLRKKTNSSFSLLQWNQRRVLDSISISRWIPPTSRQQQIVSNVTTPEVESTDIRQGLLIHIN